RLDTAGAYAILRAIHPSPTPAAPPDRTDVARLFDLVRPTIEKEGGEAEAGTWLHRFFDKIGRGIYSFADEAWRASAFAGQLVCALGRTIRHPGRLRGISVARMMETAGADALPIIVVMNFFIGTV